MHIEVVQRAAGMARHDSQNTLTPTAPQVYPRLHQSSPSMAQPSFSRTLSQDRVVVDQMEPVAPPWASNYIRYKNKLYIAVDTKTLMDWIDLEGVFERPFLDNERILRANFIKVLREDVPERVRQKYPSHLVIKVRYLRYQDLAAFFERMGEVFRLASQAPRARTPVMAAVESDDLLSLAVLQGLDQNMHYVGPNNPAYREYLNVANCDGLTAAHLAARKPGGEIILDYLAKEGADLTVLRNPPV